MATKKILIDLDLKGKIDATGTVLGSNLSGTNTGDQDLSSYSTSDTQLSDEQVEDIMGAAWISGTNNTFVYNDANGTLKINSTNTQRGIDQVPVENEFAESISSDWAFENVKTAVPANAVFTDTVNTFDGAYSSLSGTPNIPSGNNIIDWTVDQGSTNIHDNNYTNFLYTLPQATATARGGIEIFSNTDQTVAATAVSAVASRTYGIQLNAANQAVVNVPWVDTNTDTNTVYTHPSGDGNLHVIATSTTNNGKVLTAGATAGSLTWTDKTVNTDTLYTHPTTAGNKHIPTGGSVGQILINSASGTVVWGADTDTTYTSSDFTHDDLDGFVSNEHIDWTTDQGATNIHANNYTNTNTNTNQLTTFQVEDGDGTELTISHGKEWKFVEGQGININWTDVNSGTDADPFDLQFSLKSSGVRATELNVTGNGTATQYLRSDGDGSFTWATPTDTTYDLSGYLLNTTDTLTGVLTVTSDIIADTDIYTSQDTLKLTAGGTGGTYIEINDTTSLVELNADIQADSFIKNGGSSTEFLKADGSVDSSTFVSTATLSNYLLDTTDTLTGDLTITGQSSISGYTDAGYALSVGVADSGNYSIHTTGRIFGDTDLSGVYAVGRTGLIGGRNTTSTTYALDILGTSNLEGSLTVDGGTGVATSGGTLIVKQKGDTLNDGIAITSSNASSHRIWKDSSGNLNIGGSGAGSSFVQDLSGKLILPTSGTTSGTVTTPSGKLDIRSDSTWSNSAIIVRSTTNQNPVLAFYRPSGTAANSYPWWLEANGSTFQIKTGSSANIGSESVSTKLTIDNSGNLTMVGVVKAPSLEVDNGSADGGSLVLNSLGYNNWQFDNNSGALRMFTGGSVKQTILANGYTSFTSTVQSTKFYVGTLPSDNQWAFQARNSSSTADSGLYFGSGSSEIIMRDTSNALKVRIKTSGNSYFNSGGNVGIGTDAPQKELHVSSGDTTETTLMIGASGTISNVSSRILLNEGETGVTNSKDYGFSLAYDGQGSQYGLPANVFGIIRHNNSLAGNHALTIQRSNGNVGIGTDTALEKLEVQGTMYATPIAYAASQDAYALKMGAYNNTAFDQGIKIKSTSTGQSYMSFNDRSEDALVLRGAKVGIGTDNPGYRLDVDGNGRFTSTVTATNFILSSDKRLKNNVKQASNKHIDVNWKTFEMNSEEGQSRYGVIAQELEEVHPEFVRTDDEGMKSVAYIDLLIAKIAELEARLDKAKKLLTK